MTKYITPILLLASMVVLMLSTEQRTSPVNDEPANIPSGYVLLKEGFYIDATHPPLARYLFAIPYLFLKPDIHADHPAIETNWHTYGRDFIFKNRIPYKTIIFWPRLMNIALSILLAFIVFHWSKKLWGYWGGVLSLALITFEPSVLGHSSLATLDMPVAFFFFLTCYLYYRYHIKPSKTNFVIFAMSLAATPLVKFSGLVIFLGVITSMIIAVSLRGANPPRADGATKQSTLPWAPWTRFAIITAILILLTSTLYQFEIGRIGSDKQIVASRASEKVLVGIDHAASKLGMTQQQLMDFPIPLYNFLKGLGLQVFHSMRQDLWEAPDSFQYLLGQYSRKGWWYYFPVTFALKTTLPMLLLIFLAIACSLTVRAKSSAEGGGASREPFDTVGNRPLLDSSPTISWWGTRSKNNRFEFITFALAPALVYFISCMTTSINVGHRYLLPVYPFLCLGLGYLATIVSLRLPAKVLVAGGVRPPSAGETTKQSPITFSLPPFVKGGMGGFLIIVLLFSHILLSLRAFPHYIGYFNELAGGGERGWTRLADSNVDWGQDLYLLAEDVEKVRQEAAASGRKTTFYGDIFGTVKPSDLGIDLQKIPQTGEFPQDDGTQCVLYISVNKYLLRSKRLPQGLYPWIYHILPDRILGSSILVIEVAHEKSGQ